MLYNFVKFITKFEITSFTIKYKDFGCSKIMVVYRGLVRPIGFIVQQNPNMSKFILKWSINDNFWVRIRAILHHIYQKEQTNTVLLDEIISNNLGKKEFFINKAIVWSLREYSKTNPV